MKNEVTMVDACRQNDLKHSEVEGWIKASLDGGEQNLKSNAKERQESHEKELHILRAKVACVRG